MARDLKNSPSTETQAMTIKTSKFDATDYLTSPAEIEAYLEAALEENGPAFFQKALGTVARAK